MPQNGLYFGKVYHARHKPFFHDFNYSVFTFFVDIDKLSDLSKNLKWFSYNKFNIFSIFDKDYGKRDGSHVRIWIEKAAKSKNIDIKDGKIFMLGFPRLWGYLFNPITVFYCYNKQNKLVAVMHQVRNTFGELHGYLIPIENGNTTGNPDTFIKQNQKKNFHVSPFIEMDCTYAFKFDEPEDTFSFWIKQKQKHKDKKILTAGWEGERKPINDQTLISALKHNTFLTFKIILGIHWEAMKLWFKGAKYIKKPAPPEKEVS